MAIEEVDVCNQSLIALGQSTITALTDENENARRCNTLYETIRNDLLVKHPWNFAIKRATLVEITKSDPTLWVTLTDYIVDDVVEFDSTHYTCLIAHTSGGFAADLAAAKWSTTTSWLTATSYAKGDKVYNAGIAYTCLTPHTSGTFATDLTAVKWIVSIDPEYDYTYAYRIPTDNLRVLSESIDEEIKIEGGYLYTDASSIKIKYIAKITDPDDFSAEFLTALVASMASALALAITNNRNITADMKVEAKEKKLEALGTDAQGGGTPDEPKCDDWLNAR
jgi:hypothetical protein